MSSPQPSLLEQHSPDEIRSRPRPDCYLCGAPGLSLYEGVKDSLFGAPGIWSFKRCPTLSCGLVWLDPVPMEEETGKAYRKYYTHAERPTGPTGPSGLLKKGASVLLSLANPVHRERERLSLMHLDGVKPGKLLDVGCGNGARIARLRALGWDVVGQDLDLQAVTYARETFGLEVHLGRLKDIGFPEMSFDAITLNHVIEHAHDPVKLLGECGRLLRVGGRIVIVTPNSDSFAHKHFTASWRGLEPPRHIHVFSPKTLSAAATGAGLTVCHSRTTIANATTFWRGSIAIGNRGKDNSNWISRSLTRARALGYLYRSIFEHLRDTNSGEECVLLATR
jgi:2-polyprenyl-3-methyl-5-hydroxy-6-metoxy-1,4-benzoquinol methylase